MDEHATPVLLYEIQDKAELLNCYMPFLKNGGIFIPTDQGYDLGETVRVMLIIMTEPEKFSIAGPVVWITPSNVHGNKMSGVGVAFPETVEGKRLKGCIESILGASVLIPHTTYTL
jgi:type IV pilus assembly protein PilZ